MCMHNSLPTHNPRSAFGNSLPLHAHYVMHRLFGDAISARCGLASHSWEGGGNEMRASLASPNGSSQASTHSSSQASKGGQASNGEPVSSSSNGSSAGGLGGSQGQLRGALAALPPTFLMAGCADHMVRIGLHSRVALLRVCIVDGL